VKISQNLATTLLKAYLFSKISMPVYIPLLVEQVGLALLPLQILAH